MSSERRGWSWLGKGSEYPFKGFSLAHRQWGALTALGWGGPDGGVTWRSRKGKNREMPGCPAGARRSHGATARKDRRHGNK